MFVLLVTVSLSMSMASLGSISTGVSDGGSVSTFVLGALVVISRIFPVAVKVF